jgi:hypothetical protein
MNKNRSNREGRAIKNEAVNFYFEGIWKVIAGTLAQKVDLLSFLFSPWASGFSDSENAAVSDAKSASWKYRFPNLGHRPADGSRRQIALTRDALRSCSPLDSWRSSRDLWPATRRR